VIYDPSCIRACCGYARQDAEKIDVGSARLSRSIRKPLLSARRKGREGKVVAPAKVGRSLRVRTRGGQEALFLHEQGVLFEVVPGILPRSARRDMRACPSRTPAAATTRHVRARPRRIHSSVTAPEVDWSALARLAATVICYAGRASSRKFSRRSRRRLREGRAAAVCTTARLPSQETSKGPAGSDRIENARQNRPSCRGRAPRFASTCAGRRAAALR